VSTPAAGTIVVLAKVPELFQVKTRLVPPFSHEQARDFYAAMLADVLAATARFSRELGLTPVVAVHPWQRRTAVACIAPAGFRVVPQRGSDLAARMTWAARESAAAGAQRILLRGSDSPTLDAQAVGEALAALREFDLVLRPDCDGGYGLVGLRRPAAGLFGHAMSTPSVLADTRANADRLGLRSFVSEGSFDIDTACDLGRLAAARSPAVTRLCPRTLAYLDDNALWPAVYSAGGPGAPGAPPAARG
jgi:rSAM/selenodomain-associated transferase 1